MGARLRLSAEALDTSQALPFVVCQWFVACFNGRDEIADEVSVEPQSGAEGTLHGINARVGWHLLRGLVQLEHVVEPSDTLGPGV